MNLSGVASAPVNTTQTLQTVVVPNDQLVMRLDNLRVKATGNITGVGGVKHFSLRLGTSMVSFPSYSGEGPWTLDATIISTSAVDVRIIATLTTESGPMTVFQTHNVGAARPWSVTVLVRTVNPADTVTQNLLAVLP